MTSFAGESWSFRTSPLFRASGPKQVRARVRRTAPGPRPPADSELFEERLRHLEEGQALSHQALLRERAAKSVLEQSVGALEARLREANTTLAMVKARFISRQREFSHAMDRISLPEDAPPSTPESAAPARGPSSEELEEASGALLDSFRSLLRQTQQRRVTDRTGASWDAKLRELLGWAGDVDDPSLAEFCNVATALAVVEVFSGAGGAMARPVVSLLKRGIHLLVRAETLQATEESIRRAVDPGDDARSGVGSALSVVVEQVTDRVLQARAELARIMSEKIH
jgi:hypothetical protein